MIHPEREKDDDAPMITATSLAEAIDYAKNGTQSMVKCTAPGHDDGNASLHVSPGSKQPVVMKCHASCETQNILAGAGVDFQMLLSPRDETDYGRFKSETDIWTPVTDPTTGKSLQPSHIYKYTDEDGALLYEVLRIPTSKGKDFRQRHPDPSQKSGWKWNMNGVRRVLYHLPEVLKAKANGETIYLVEGEKDVETLRMRGFTATTSPMGAGKWMAEYTEALSATNVVIVSDADTPGRDHARAVKEALDEVGCVVSITEAMNGCKDVTDHFAAGGTLETLNVTVPATVEGKESYGMDILDAIEREIKPSSFVIPNVLASGDRWLLTGFEGHGKLLKLDTPIVTTSGWTTMEKIQPGEMVLDQGGKPCTVVAKSEVQYPDEASYRVEFSDGTHVIAGDSHQWVTWTIEAREADARKRRKGGTYTPKHLPSTVTTQQIKDTLKVRDGHAVNHAIRVGGALDLPECWLPVAPYTMGAWLGDGTSTTGQLTIGTRDMAITEGFAADGYESYVIPSGYRKEGSRSVRVKDLTVDLMTAGVLKNKHIPGVYLRASIEQRKALLAGICDTDGYIDPRGADTGKRGSGNSMVEVVFTNERLALDTLELVRSLGIIPRYYEGDATIDGEFISRKYRICFQSPFNPFRHAGFKADRWRPLQTQRAQYRYITAVEPVEQELMQCIQVDSPSHTYLCGEAMVPTHNSTFCRQLAVQVAAGIHPWTSAEMEPQKVLVVDTENHPDQVLDSWQDMIGRAARLGRPVQRGMLILQEEWDNQIDLNESSGKRWLIERVNAHQPKLIVIGPLYNLANKDLSEHAVVNEMKSAINEARSICGSAVIMEHHAPHRGNGDKDRSVRPYGSSTFLKWPDFGYGLKPEEIEGYYELQKTRFPRVRSRHFPGWVRWGKPNTLEWPWEAVSDPEAEMLGFGSKKF